MQVTNQLAQGLAILLLFIAVAAFFMVSSKTSYAIGLVVMYLMTSLTYNKLKLEAEELREKIP